MLAKCRPFSPCGKKDIRENDCHSAEMGCNATITCRTDAHTHTVDQPTNRRRHNKPPMSVLDPPHPPIFELEDEQPRTGECSNRFFFFFLFFLDSAAMRAILIISLKLYGRKICPPSTLMELIHYVSKQQCLGLKSKMVSLKRKQKVQMAFSICCLILL